MDTIRAMRYFVRAVELRSLGASARLLVAAPDYLAARGTPLQPEQFAEHDYVRFAWAPRGDLVSVLPAWRGEHQQLSLLTPSRRYRPLRTTLFIEFMTSSVAAMKGFQM